MKAASAVEWFKRGSIYLLKAKTDEERKRAANHAIDIFISAKWILVLSLWFTDVTSPAAVALVVYLLVMNLHTYFWYHLWARDNGSFNDPARIRRRFVNLGLAVTFSILSFAYLYSGVLHDQFHWDNAINAKSSAITFSVGNALTSFSGEAKPSSSLASMVCSAQLLTTYVFLAILLSNSIPKTKD